MIIRLSINDSNYTTHLENFARRINSIRTTSSELLSEILEDNDYRVQYANYITKLNYEQEELSDEEIEKLIMIIKAKYSNFCNICLTPDICEYVKNNTEISYQTTLTPRNENGKTVYIFLTSKCKYLVF